MEWFRPLALHLATLDDPEAALRAYQADRRTPTNRIVLANRFNGPDHAMQLTEERAPDVFDDLDEVLAPEELVAIAKQYEMVAGFDENELSGRASIDPHV